MDIQPKSTDGLMDPIFQIMCIFFNNHPYLPTKESPLSFCNLDKLQVDMDKIFM